MFDIVAVSGHGLLLRRRPADVVVQVRRPSSGRHGSVLHLRDGPGDKLDPPVELRSSGYKAGQCFVGCERAHSVGGFWFVFAVGGGWDGAE